MISNECQTRIKCQLQAASQSNLIRPSFIFLCCTLHVNDPLLAEQNEDVNIYLLRSRSLRLIFTGRKNRDKIPMSKTSENIYLVKGCD